MLRLLFLVVFVLLPSALVAQPPPAAAPSRQPATGRNVSTAWPSLDTIPASPAFESLDARVRIAFPRNVQGFGALSPRETGTTATGMEFTWKFAEAEVKLFFLDSPDSAMTGTPEDLAQVAKNLGERIVARSPGSRLISEGGYVLNGVPAATMLFEMPSQAFIHVQLFLDKKRLYQFSSSFKDRTAETKLKTVLATFKLISQTEVDAALLKRYEAMKPAPLPQTPVVSKERSDAEDEGLKGNVRKVVEESEDRSGTWGMQGRKLSSVDYYNQNGALLQRDSYDSQGNPFQITMYGYLNGKRVSTSKATDYEYDPPPMTLSVVKAPKSAAKADPRYEYSFGFKYVGGKLAERQMFLSDGSKGMRYVYKHSKNQLEELVYSDDGKLNQRYLTTLDDAGNQIESTDVAVVNQDLYGDRRYRYIYEFDKEGNWIKRTTQKQITKDGATSFQPYYISYRTITYF